MQRLILNIENETITDKLLWMLKHFEKDGVKIDELISTKKPSATTKYTDDYIEKHWKDMGSKALASVDADANDWKMEYGSYLAEINK